MSAAIRKLEQLLSRVQSRRNEPRTRMVSPEAMSVHVEAQQALHIEPQHVEPLALKPEMMRVPPPTAPHVHEVLRDVGQTSPERASRPVPMTPLENAMGQLGQSAPLNLSPTPVAKVPAAKPPAVHDDLMLDDFDDGPPTIRPPDSFDAPPMRQPTKVDVPKVSAPHAELRHEPPKVETSRHEEEKPTRVAPALPDEPPAHVEVKPVRIATAEPLVASPVTTVSSGRASVPKTFAQLVERSLALRPRR